MTDASDIKTWETDYILKECKEQMGYSADRGYYVDEIARRIAEYQRQVEELQAGQTQAIIAVIDKIADILCDGDY